MPPKQRKRKPGSSGATWLGSPLRTVGDETYYRGFTREGEEFLVGDVVALDAGRAVVRKCRDGVFIAEVESLWEDAYGAMWAECRW